MNMRKPFPWHSPSDFLHRRPLSQRPLSRRWRPALLMLKPQSIEHAVSHETKSATDTVKKARNLPRRRFQRCEDHDREGEKRRRICRKERCERCEVHEQDNFKRLGICREVCRKELVPCRGTTLKSSGVENVAKATTKTIEKSAEHPQETAKGWRRIPRAGEGCQDRRHGSSAR